MLSKKTFVAAMNAIVKHKKIMDELKVPLLKLGDFPAGLDIESIHREALLKVLMETTGDDSDWLTWWLYDEVDKTVFWEEDGVEKSADLTTLEALYDFLKANIEYASRETLPMTQLLEGDNGIKRIHIEKHNFRLYYEACLKYIDSTGTTLLVCEDNTPQYAVMPFSQCARERASRGIWHIPCPECGALTDVKIISYRKDYDGVDLITHCPYCHRDWGGQLDKFGEMQHLDRHFWG